MTLPVRKIREPALPEETSGGRVPPSDLDAEAAVLSACLHSRAALDDVRQILASADFYADANRRIYEACLELAVDGVRPDIVLVAGLLRTRGRLQQIGGSPYLAQLSDATPAVANVVEHAKVVVAKAQQRAVIAACQRFAAEGFDDVGDVTKWTQDVAQTLADVTGGRSRVASRLEVIGSEAIFAELGEPDYLIEPIIRRGSLVELVAYGSSGKSWMGLDAILSVGAGVPWLGRFATKQGGAVALDWENGAFEDRRRLQAMARARGLGVVQGIGLVAMPGVYMSDPRFGETIEPIAERNALITIDTLKAANPGTDENDSNMRLGLDALRRVGEKTGCAFLVLVHSKKVSGTISTLDAREAGRGSSAIFDAADVVLHATYAEGEPLRVQQTKSRQGRPVEPFLVKITDTDVGILVSARDVATGATEASDEFENVVCTAVLECVRANPGVSLRLLAEKSGKRHRTVAAALEQLERHGAVKNTGSERAGRWFSV